SPSVKRRRDESQRHQQGDRAERDEDDLKQVEIPEIGDERQTGTFGRIPHRYLLPEGIGRWAGRDLPSDRHQFLTILKLNARANVAVEVLVGVTDNDSVGDSAVFKQHTLIAGMEINAQAEKQSPDEPKGESNEKHRMVSQPCHLATTKQVAAVPRRQTSLSF